MSGAVVLAAGAGRRLGGVAKAALQLADGRTFLQAVHDTGRAAGVAAWVVVVGPPHAAETRRLAESLGLPVVRNPAPGRGMASSVALGFEYAIKHFSGQICALLWPVDHPQVQAPTVRTILDHARAQRVVIARHGERGGHPCAFGSHIWPALAGCADAARGARTVIDELSALDASDGCRPGSPEARVCRLCIDDAGLIADVDTPRALAEIGAQGGHVAVVER